VPFKVPYNALLKVPHFVLEVSHNRFTRVQGQKTIYFLIINIAVSALFSQCLKWFDKGFSLSKPLFSKSLLLWLVFNLQHGNK